MQDDTAGIQVVFPRRKAGKSPGPVRSSKSKLGWRRDVGNPVISAAKISVLGQARCRHPNSLGQQLMNARLDAQWIELEGSWRSTDGAHLLMFCSAAK